MILKSYKIYNKYGIEAVLQFILDLTDSLESSYKREKRNAKISIAIMCN